MAKQFFAIEYVNDNFNVGEVKQSILTEAQFQSLYGDTWVLMDGRDVTGSDLAVVTGNNTLPDARGVFLRGKNNGRSDGNENPDGESAIGTFQNDQNLAHNHLVPSWYVFSGGSPTAAQTTDTGLSAGTKNISSAGSGGPGRDGSEARPKNITVNTFVKINR
jgi:hypothetical protein